MGLEFLVRVRRTSLAAGFFGALAAFGYASLEASLGVAAGVAWSVANLWMLQQIVTGLITPDRTPAAARRAIVGAAGTLALFAVGAVLLIQLPTVALAIGFTVPFAVIALKAASRMLLDSPAWRRITRSAWTGVALIALAVGGTWVAAQLLRPVLPTPAIAASDPHTPVSSDDSLTTGHGATTTHPGDPHAQPAAGTEHGAAAHGEAGHGEAESGPKAFPNVLGILIATNHDAPWAKFLHHFEYVIFSMFVALVLAVVTIVATRNPKMIPGRMQNLVESIVEAASGFFIGILGPKYGPRFVPFLGTLFLYIWAMNFFGTIPFMHSPTANLNITVAMALAVFGYVQFTAFRELGVMGWLDHMAGQPRGAIGWALVPLMLPVHLIGEVAKPISLSCRLFGNIFGEDMLLVGFATLGVTALSAFGAPFGLPLQLPFMFLGVFITQPVQALVFTMLSTVYFLLMLPHDHGHGHEGEAHSHAH